MLLLCLPLLFLTGSPFINQERFAGGLLCQDVHVASTPSPTPAFMLLGKPVMLGFLSGRSATKIYLYIWQTSNYAKFSFILNNMVLWWWWDLTYHNFEKLYFILRKSLVYEESLWKLEHLHCPHALNNVNHWRQKVQCKVETTKMSNIWGVVYMAINVSNGSM